MSKGKILLVDDEPLVREELGGLLQDEGYQVVTAADGEQALRAFEREQPAMVITDVKMPRRDGLSLAAAIRELNPAVPITIITGHGNETLAIQALRAGVTDFIKKPVRWEDLSAAIGRMRKLLQAPEHPELAPAVVLEEHCWSYRLENEITAVPGFVDHVLASCLPEIEAKSRQDLRLALRELVVNAIEHGNLALSYQDKSSAINSGELSLILAQRSGMECFQGRKVLVTIRRREQEVELQVTDEGEGFDWRSLPDPNDPANLLASHGRGILLARLSVDQLSFNERGNVVTIRKRLV